MDKSNVDAIMNLEQYERRAAEAEERLNRLEEALFGKCSVATNEELVAVVENMHTLRRALGKAKLDMDTLQQKFDCAVAREMELVEENRKMKYRMKHLIRAVKAGGEEIPTENSKTS